MIQETVPPLELSANDGSHPKLKLSLQSLQLDDVECSEIPSGPNSVGDDSVISSVTNWSGYNTAAISSGLEFSETRSPNSSNFIAANAIRMNISKWYSNNNRISTAVVGKNKRKLSIESDGEQMQLNLEMSPDPNLLSLQLIQDPIDCNCISQQAIPISKFSPLSESAANIDSDIPQRRFFNDNTTSAVPQPEDALESESGILLGPPPPTIKQSEKKFQSLVPTKPEFPTQPDPPNPVKDIFQISFLGTGSATPSKYRNASSILMTLLVKTPSTFISFADNNSEDTPTTSLQVLIDVGEGTSAQMFQLCGANELRFDEMLLGISVIWISHHHADHCCGIPMLLENIQKAKDRQLKRQKSNSIDSSIALEFGSKSSPSTSYNGVSAQIRRQIQKQSKSSKFEKGKILIFASDNVLAYVEYAACVAGLDDLISSVPISATLYAGNKDDISAATGGIIMRIQSIPVYHCQHSYGCVLEFRSKHKFVYSGDCRCYFFKLDFN